MFILISQELRPLRRRLSERFPRAAASRWLSALCTGGTLFTVGLFRTLDLYRLPRFTFRFWRSALSPAEIARLFDVSLWRRLQLSLPQWILIAICVLVMWLVGRATRRVGDANGESLSARLARRPMLYATVCALMVVAIAVFGYYGMEYDPMDFIYGQFYW